MDKVVITPVEPTLHQAVRTQDLETVATLINEGIDVNKKNSEGYTSLHLAVIWKSEKIIELLLSAGADVNIKNDHDSTALQYALNYPYENFDIIKTLIEAGGDVNSRDSIKGSSALHWSVEQNDINMADYLLTRGANVNLKDYKGQTPLHWFVAHNQGRSHLDLLEMLLKYGADMSAQDKEDKTPYDYLALSDKNVDSKVFEFFCKNQDDVVQFGSKIGTVEKIEADSSRCEDEEFEKDVRAEKNTSDAVMILLKEIKEENSRLLKDQGRHKLYKKLEQEIRDIKRENKDLKKIISCLESEKSRDDKKEIKCEELEQKVEEVEKENNELKRKLRICGGDKSKDEKREADTFVKFSLILIIILNLILIIMQIVF